MKKIICSICLLLLVFTAMAQSQADIDKAMKEMKDVMKDMPPEAKKMMDSMKINEKLTKGTKDLKAKGITDKQIKEAVEDANRLVPKRNTALILRANKRLKNEMELKSFLGVRCDAIEKAMGIKALADMEKLVKYLRQKSNGSEVSYSGTAVMLMFNNKPASAMAALLEEFHENPQLDYTDINNFSALCNIMGGQEVSLPILNFLNIANPDNSVVLNNIGQAWYTCGERDSAEVFLKKAVSLVDYNPEANETLCLIYRDKGMYKEAEDALKKSILAEYSPKKAETAKNMGVKLTKDDYNLPPKLKYDPLGFSSIKKPDFQVDLMDYYRHAPIQEAWYDAIKAEIAKLKDDGEKLTKEIYPDNPDKMMSDFREKTKNVTNPNQALRSVGLGPHFLKILSFLSDNPDQAPEVLFAKNSQNQGENQLNFEARRSEFRDIASKIKWKEDNKCISKQADFLIKNINPQASARCDKDINEYISYYTDALYYYMYLNDESTFELMKMLLKIRYLEMLKSDADDGEEGGPDKSCYKNSPPGNVKLAKWEDTHCPVFANFEDPTGTFSIYWDCRGSVTKVDCPIYKETETYKYDLSNKLSIKGSYWMGFEMGKTLGGKGAEKLPVKLGLKGSLGYYQETKGGTLADGFAQLYDVKDRPRGNVITDEGVQASAEAKSELNLKYFGQDGEIIDKLTSNPFKEKTSTGTTTSVINPNPLKLEVGEVKPEVKLKVTGKLSFNNGPNTLKTSSSVFGWDGTNFFGDAKK